MLLGFGCGLTADMDVPLEMPRRWMVCCYAEVADATRTRPNRGQLRGRCNALLRIRCADIPRVLRDRFADAKT
jgi:hypothetical protein